MEKGRRFQLKEWHRTVLLLLLIAVAIGFILWSKNQYSINFTESF